MTKTVAIVGAGGFGRELYDQINDSSSYQDGLTVAGFVDKSTIFDLHSGQELKWLGTDEDFIAAASADSVIIAIGDPTTRAGLVQTYGDAGVEIVSYVHPTAFISPSAYIGSGSIVCAQAMIMNAAQVGAFCHIDRSGMIGHDSQLSDLVSVYPAAIVSGRVSIGTRAQIGTGARILPEMQIGAGAFVGAGAVVTRHVGQNETVVGVPARTIQPGARCRG